MTSRQTRRHPPGELRTRANRLPTMPLPTTGKPCCWRGAPGNAPDDRGQHRPTA